MCGVVLASSIPPTKPRPLCLSSSLRLCALLVIRRRWPAVLHSPRPTPHPTPHTPHHRYLQWIIYSVLVCPQLLIKSPRVLNVFQTAAADCLVLPIYRDLILDVHGELKTLAGWFPKSAKKLYVGE